MRRLALLVATYWYQDDGLRQLTASGRDDLTLLYFTGHGMKDDEGRLYLVAVAPDGRHIYITNSNSGNVSVIEVANR